MLGRLVQLEEGNPSPTCNTLYTSCLYQKDDSDLPWGGLGQLSASMIECSCLSWFECCGMLLVITCEGVSYR